jgi:NitT/TauT family transport system ATP-binding protein
LQIEARGMDVAAYRRRALDLLELTGLKGFENKYPNELSGGMQQRVSISRALIHDPPLLLMDEPFGALDAITRDEMNLELLHIWQEAKKTVLFITHSIAEAVFLGDRVVVMTPRPGKVDDILTIDLPRPRATAMRDDPKFIDYVKKIRERLGVQ